MTSVDGGGGKGDNSERSSNQHDTSDQQLPVASCRDSARERRAAKGRRVAPVLHGYTSSYSNMSCCNVVSRKARGRSLALSRRGRYSGCRGRAAPRARTPPRRGARPEVALRLPARQAPKRPRSVHASSPPGRRGRCQPPRAAACRPWACSCVLDFIVMRDLIISSAPT